MNAFNEAWNLLKSRTERAIDLKEEDEEGFPSNERIRHIVGRNDPWDRGQTQIAGFPQVRTRGAGKGGKRAPMMSNPFSTEKETHGFPRQTERTNVMHDAMKDTGSQPGDMEDYDYGEDVEEHGAGLENANERALRELLDFRLIDYDDSGPLGSYGDKTYAMPKLPYSPILEDVVEYKR